MISVKRFPKIQAEHAFYEAFLNQNKIAQENPVELERDSPKVEYIGSVAVEMGWASFPCFFEAAKSPKKVMKYGLRIFARYFDDDPCVRFCSRGAPHVNEEEGDGLPARSIPTPHFHKVDSRGTMRAYQTPLLADPTESARIIADPQLGTNLFCQEANLFSESGDFVAVRIVTEELDLSNDDPLGGATFPPP